MKVLVIGRGVVGTIYGWALSEAGIDVLEPPQPIVQTRHLTRGK